MSSWQGYTGKHIMLRWNWHSKVVITSIHNGFWNGGVFCAQLWNVYVSFRQCCILSLLTNIYWWHWSWTWVLEKDFVVETFIARLLSWILWVNPLLQINFTLNTGGIAHQTACKGTIVISATTHISIKTSIVGDFLHFCKFPSIYNVFLVWLCTEWSDKCCVFGHTSSGRGSFQNTNELFNLRAL